MSILKKHQHKSAEIGMNQCLLDKIIKYTLYLLVFLLPIFFLPLTLFPLALNKQMMLAIFVFFLLDLWVIKVISSGKLSFRWNKLTASVFLVLLILGISTAFSGARVQSFWGMNFEPDTLFSFILYLLVFLLFANLVDIKVEAKIVLVIFLASSGILATLFLIQSFWRPIFPWDFAKISGFNLIGTVQGLSVFLGGAFVILMTLINADNKNYQHKSAEVGINQRSKINQLTRPNFKETWAGKSAKISGKAILKKINSILPAAIGILLFVSILLINYRVTFLLIIFAVTAIIWSRLKTISINQPKSVHPPKFLQSKNLGGQISVPLAVLMISLLFTFIRIPTENIVSFPAEITPTYKATLDISKSTLLEGFKNFILGSGLATFSYDYDLYRSLGPNLTDFWQVRFSQGSAFLPTLLAMSGILGVLAVFSMLVIFFYQGFKNLISINQPKSALISGTQLAAFVGSAYFLISWFFYPINFSLAFATFLILGLFTAISINQPKSVHPPKFQRNLGGQVSVAFIQSPQKAFFIMLVGILLIVGSVVALFTISQKYRAALAFSEGLSLVNAPEPKLDEAIINLSKAVTLDKKDSYFRNLSQLFLLKINEVLNSKDLSQEEKQKLLQQVVSNAEISAQTATRINPANSQNWFQQANVYENFMIVNVEGAGELAVLAFQKAGELAPQNPQIPFNLGRVYKTTAERIQVQIALLGQEKERNEDTIKQLEEDRDKIFESALQELKKSIRLKNNFTPAYYLMAQIYETQGNKELALQNYQIVLLLEPGNEEIQKKVEELSK